MEHGETLSRIRSLPTVMLPGRLQVQDVAVSVLARQGVKTALHQATAQRLTVCETSQVLAVANGRLVDLYGVSNDLQHLVFLAQVALDEYVTRQTVNNDGDRTAVVLATCVCFPIAGFLLVGAVAEGLQDVKNRVLVLGFRLYATSVSQYAVPHESGASKRPPAPVQVHFSFLEPVPDTSTSSIRSLQPCHRGMTPDSGSVLLLLTDSNVFGVLNWTERFSARQMCLAKLKQHADSLIAAAINPSGQFVVLTDAVGRLALLDFHRFPWTGQGHSDSYSVEGKRLQLGACSRSGVLARDNPLDVVRMVHTVVTAGSSSACSVRWWKYGGKGQEKEFILAGRQDGSLSVLQLIQETVKRESNVVELKLTQMYPGLAADSYDAIRSISKPVKVAEIAGTSSSSAVWFEFCTLSAMRWRLWRVKVTGLGESSPKGQRVIWPSLKESLDFPTFTFQSKEIIGVAVLSQTTALPQSIAKRLATNPGEFVQQPITVVLAEDCVRFISRLTASLEASTTSEGKEDTVEEVTQSGQDDARECGLEENHEAPVGVDPLKRHREQRSSSAPPIQSKYRLPPMDWKAKRAASGPGDEQKAAVGSQEVAVNDAPPPTKLSRVDYDKRVATVVHRVDNLSSVLKTMRMSFQLFSSDVQQHMQLLTEQLEEATRQRVAEEAATP